MSSEWNPLEQMLGPELCERFMFMGRTGRSIGTSTSTRGDT